MAYHVQRIETAQELRKTTCTTQTETNNGCGIHKGCSPPGMCKPFGSKYALPLSQLIAYIPGMRKKARGKTCPSNPQKGR